MFPLDPGPTYSTGQIDPSETDLSFVSLQVLVSSAGSARPRGPADLLSINYDVLPNIYAPKIVHGAAGGFTFVAFS
jgi:hypothetical protein